MFEFITGSLPVLFLTACIAAVLLGIERADREVVYEQTNNIPWGLSAVRVLLLLFVLILFFAYLPDFQVIQSIGAWKYLIMALPVFLMQLAKGHWAKVFHNRNGTTGES